MSLEIVLSNTNTNLTKLTKDVKPSKARYVMKYANDKVSEIKLLFAFFRCLTLKYQSKTILSGFNFSLAGYDQDTNYLRRKCFGRLCQTARFAYRSLGPTKV